VIWRLWRTRAGAAVPEHEDPFEDLLEDAPVMALLIDVRGRVLAANAAARAYFRIDARQLPSSVIETTREGGLSEQLRLGRPEGELRLVHRQRVVTTLVVPGPAVGDSLLFLTDVTELRRLQTVRQEFVANLAHELKTPLTSLRLAVESLDVAPADARQKLVQRALKEADQLSAVVDNLRLLTEIESGGVTVQPSRIGLAGLLQEVAERAAPRQVEVDAARDLTVEADRAKLAQALGNLVENAAKFTPSDTPVELSAELSGQELLIHVRDHGPGISPEHWDRVFERFYKVDPARPRDVPGTGLGLAITKHLVLAMGGRVWTEAAPDGGQVFSIALPLLNSAITRD
jgi:two-component system phosphate regulon sensor histidine kinase PhoR